MVNGGGQRPIETNALKHPHPTLSRNRKDGFWIYWLVVSVLATWVIVAPYALAMAPLETFVAVGTSRNFASARGVYEFAFQERCGPSAFDRIGLHRITLGPVPVSHPTMVMLYLPGTNMNGEVAIDDSRYSLPLYLPSRGVDFWALDYRTHFVPPSTPSAGLAELQTWTNEMFQADISAAVRFVMANSKQNQIFLAGFSRGALFAYLYAAAHPESVKGLVILDGAIGHGRGGSPPPGVYADDVSGRHLTWDKRQALMKLVIDHPNAAAPLPKFKSAADNLNHVVFDSAGFGGKGGLANPFAGLADPSVLARVLVRYDRYWPNVQDYENSFTPLMAESLKHSQIPVLAFSSTNISPEWPAGVAKSATSTGSRDVTVKILHNWGHLDVICGTRAEQEVFAPVLIWLKRHSQAASDSGG
jgi:pimeloyl-ACP methyl ester carboxylesterase